MSSNRCRCPTRRFSSSRIIKTASVAAAALAAATSVTALQPHQPIKAKVRASRTSTSLDYVNVVAAPETDTESETRNLKELEKLLLLGITTMEPKMPVEVGVTRASPNTSASTAPPALKETTPAKQQGSKKKRVIRRRRKATTTNALPSATSRLTSAARLKRKAGKQHARKRPELESVYWVRHADTGKQALLTREEEIEATDKIRALRRAEHVRDEHLHDHSPLTEKQWATACGLESPLDLRKVIRQGQEARSLLVQANMGLVIAIAKRQHSSLKFATEAGNGVGTILTLQDFLQEGQIGLIKASERFDASRGVRFSTYATWWIRQRIQRSISDSSRIIRLPAHGKFIEGLRSVQIMISTSSVLTDFAFL